MPIYEYSCPTCGQSFEKLVRNTSAPQEIVCPNCGNHEVRKKLSTFATSVKGGAFAASSSSASSCGPTGL